MSLLWANTFCDASTKTYATAVYLWVQNQEFVGINLVFLKMRMVSKGLSTRRKKKELTIPRLELLAVTIGVHAANFV